MQLAYKELLISFAWWFAQVYFPLIHPFKYALFSPDVATSDGTATSADYTAVSSTVTFAANDPAITQTVALTTDTVLEDLEYLTFWHRCDG